VNQTLRYCGRDFTDADLERIRQLISEEPRKNRAQLSRAVCQQLGWSKPDGGLKEMSCRVAMLRMHRDGLITLPEPRNGNGNGQPYRRVTRATDPGLPIDQSVEQLTDLRLEVVEDRRTSHL